MNRYDPPGQLIDLGLGFGIGSRRCRLHIYQEGVGYFTGQPTVILESGIAGSLLSWSLVQPRLAEFTRVCSYDRAGLGWSDRCAQPRTVANMVSELANLLERAHVPQPYILVGHSFGGLLIRAYAHLWPRQVAGLVFVDPVSLETWAHCEPHNQLRLKTGVRLARRGALLARLGVVKLALWMLASGGTRIPKLLARTTAQRGFTTVERLTGEVSRLPPEVWPMIRAHWSRPKSFEAMAAHLECLPAAAAEALSMPLPPDLPFIVLSAASSKPVELNEREAWVQASRRGQHRRVENSAHWIQLEQPEEVIAAIREVWREAGTYKIENPQ